MRVFLDMDGVLCDFIEGIHRALGLDYDINAYPYELGKWDNLSDIGGLNLPFKVIDSLCTSDFWADLTWHDDGHDILCLVLDRFDADEVCLLTSPMPNSGSATGKVRWIEKNLPAFKRQFIIAPVSKGLLAEPGRILIDDRDKNIREWREAGGIGVSVPRPWNKLHQLSDDVHNIVRKQLDFAVGYTNV